ncbi:MAG: class I SAM-dependent methyltransferase [Lachnospiraceae bacterium]|nr:class I SAM-dependent methyltransferase [Lachnospiraceae bacterium]
MSNKADFYEYLKDAELGISTRGRIERHADKSKYPYEPTSYSVLDRLCDSGYLNDNDCLLDYGCGKGRVVFYLHERIGCETIGIEIEQDFYDDAIGNRNDYHEKTQKDTGRIRLFRAKAQSFEVPEEVTACFFFNPFSSDIFKNAMARILESMRRYPRRVRLFLYYPGEKYMNCLSGTDGIRLLDEIDCRDLFPEEDDRNRIMIYEIGESG